MWYLIYVVFSVTGFPETISAVASTPEAEVCKVALASYQQNYIPSEDGKHSYFTCIKLEPFQAGQFG